MNLKGIEIYFILLIVMLPCAASFRFGIRRVASINNCCRQSTSNGPKIAPTPQEVQLFEDLKLCIQKKNLNTTVRVVGGWVRDRLLGLPSKDDIDVTLDNMSGRQFVAHLGNYYNESGIVMGMGITKLNPSKSKHLETATARIRNKFSVDFVNLRTERYTEASRVPIIEVGTPEEDAFRRDLTINALSYNIHTDQVEDFTEKGIEDLLNGVIRTPLDPLVTLTDDPLRALRVVRFACRFNFNIFPTLMAACADESVIESLKVKISRQRVHDELEGMWLQAPPRKSLRAMLLLRHFGVLRTVLDPVVEPEKVIASAGHEKSTLLSAARYTSEFGVLSLLLGNHMSDVSLSSSSDRFNHLVAVFRRIEQSVEVNKLLT